MRMQNVQGDTSKVASFVSSVMWALLYRRPSFHRSLCPALSMRGNKDGAHSRLLQARVRYADLRSTRRACALY